MPDDDADPEDDAPGHAAPDHAVPAAADDDDDDEDDVELVDLRDAGAEAPLNGAPGR